MEKYNAVHQSKREMMWNNFLGGIAWAFGATVGLSLIIGLLTLIAKNINFIPIVGDFVARIVDYVINYNKGI